MDCNQPIFIFGSPRSGTSLLSRVLNAHPEIAIPFESLFYSTFMPILDAYGDLDEDANFRRLVKHMLAWDPVSKWEPPLEFEDVWSRIKRRDIHGVVAAAIESWAEQQGARIWGEKSPWHAFYWKELREAFPEARFVHIVRDPRDATLSWKKARQGPRNAYVLSCRWSEYLTNMAEIRKETPTDLYYELTYENLISDPEGQVSALCNSLGVQYSSSMLDFYQQQGEYTTDATNRLNLTRPILQSNTGKWSTELSPKEIEWIEGTCGQTMVEFGYQPTSAPKPISVPEQALIKLVLNPPTRLYGMVKDFQGQWQGLQKVYFPIAAKLGAAR